MTLLDIIDESNLDPKERYLVDLEWPPYPRYLCVLEAEQIHDEKNRAITPPHWVTRAGDDDPCHARDLDIDACKTITFYRLEKVVEVQR